MTGDSPQHPLVLLVGFCKTVETLLRQELGASGIVFQTAAGGGEAIYRLMRTRPTIVLVDATAPDFANGSLAAAMAVEANDVPVIAVSEPAPIDVLLRAVRQELDKQLLLLCEGRDAKSDPRQMTVLVVEDDDDLREVLTLELQLHGFAVEPARDGMEALERLDPSRQDVVLLDLMMPRLGGVGFLSRMEERTLTPPPVVIYSALSEPALSQHPRVSAVLRKGEDLELLVSALRRSTTVAA